MADKRKLFDVLIILNICCLFFQLLMISCTLVVHKSAATTVSTTKIYPTDKIVYPLSSIPVIQLRGKSFVAKVNAPSNATGWSLLLSTEYDEVPLKLNQATYEDPDLWLLNATIPHETSEDLYALTVSFMIGNSEEVYAQPRAVQVLESFPSKLRFVQMADTHIGSGGEREQAFVQAIREVNLIQPAFVLISGDLANYGNYDEVNERFYSMLQTITVPTFLCPGNHDLWGGTEGYIRHFGQLYYSVDFGPYHIISLSGGPSDTASFDDSQLSWLKEDLVSHTNSAMTIMQVHHPIYLPEFMTNKTALQFILNLIDAYNISSVLTGHLHRNYVHASNKTLFVTTAAVGDGYRIVEIENRTILSYDFTPQNYLNYGYHPSNDGSYVPEVMLAKIENKHEQSFESLILKFIVSKNIDLTEYRVFNGLRYKVINARNAYVFYVATNVSSGQTLIVAVALTLDAIPPIISVPIIKQRPEPPLYDIAVETTVRDEGWGTKNVTMVYAINDGPWIREAMNWVGQDLYITNIPNQKVNVTLTYYLFASDLAGNMNHTLLTKYQVSPPQLCGESENETGHVSPPQLCGESENETGQVTSLSVVSTILLPLILLGWLASSRRLRPVRLRQVLSYVKKCARRKIKSFGQQSF